MHQPLTTCPACGYQNEAATTICGLCHEPLATVPLADTTSMMPRPIPQAGPLEQPAVNTQSLANRSQPDDPTLAVTALPVAPLPSPTAPSRRLLWLALGLLVVVLGGIGLAALQPGSSRPSLTAAPTATIQLAVTMGAASPVSLDPLPTITPIIFSSNESPTEPPLAAPTPTVPAEVATDKNKDDGKGNDKGAGKGKAKGNK